MCLNTRYRNPTTGTSSKTGCPPVAYISGSLGDTGVHRHKTEPFQKIIIWYQLSYSLPYHGVGSWSKGDKVGCCERVLSTLALGVRGRLSVFGICCVTSSVLCSLFTLLQPFLCHVCAVLYHCVWFMYTFCLDRSLTQQCVCVCECACTCACVHAYVCVFVCMQMDVCMGECVCVHACVCACVFRLK